MCNPLGRHSPGLGQLWDLLWQKDFSFPGRNKVKQPQGDKLRGGEKREGDFVREKQEILSKDKSC